MLWMRASSYPGGQRQREELRLRERELPAEAAHFNGRVGCRARHCGNSGVDTN